MKISKQLIKAIEEKKLRNAEYLKWLATLVKDGQFSLTRTVEIEKTTVCIYDVLKQAWESIQGVISIDSLKSLNKICQKIISSLLYPTQSATA